MGKNIDKTLAAPTKVNVIMRADLLRVDGLVIHDVTVTGHDSKYDLDRKKKNTINMAVFYSFSNTCMLTGVNVQEDEDRDQIVKDHLKAGYYKVLRVKQVEQYETETVLFEV